MSGHSLNKFGTEITVADGFEHPVWMADCVSIVLDAFASVDGIKNIRNQRLYISKAKDSWPRAIEPLDQGGQRIDLPTAGSACALAVYYLGHELGHVVSGFERRFSQDNKRHLWIEEIVCGATSLYALEYATQHWKHVEHFARQHFRTYLDDLCNGDFAHPTEPLPFNDFERRAIAEEGLALPMRPYSRLLFQKVGPDVVSDACNLANIKPGLDRDQFLDQWEALCSSFHRPQRLFKKCRICTETRAASATGAHRAFDFARRCGISVRAPHRYEPCHIIQRDVIAFRSAPGQNSRSISLALRLEAPRTPGPYIWSRDRLQCASAAILLGGQGMGITVTVQCT